MNYMEQVAELLGVELGEKFKISFHGDISSNEYYIDEDRLQVGDRIKKPDSQETYTISKVSNLTGVYNINKGYADFKQIQILNSNDEYSIIKSDTQYGLLAYDYIVLDAESVKTDEFIYN